MNLKSHYPDLIVYPRSPLVSGCMPWHPAQESFPFELLNGVHVCFALIKFIAQEQTVFAGEIAEYLNKREGTRNMKTF